MLVIQYARWAGIVRSRTQAMEFRFSKFTMHLREDILEKMYDVLQDFAAKHNK
jgi:hypothetical protein